MKRSRPTRSDWAATLTLLGVAALTLAACGSTGTATPSAPTTPPMTAAAVSPTPSPGPSSKGWYLRIYNVDEVGKAYVNGALVKRVGYSKESGWVDITDYVKKTGAGTTIRFTMYNKSSGYTWGFQIAEGPSSAPDSVVWTAEEGVAGSVGANGDDQKRTRRIVYDKTLNLKDLAIASPAP
jgi:hypothetical protein